MIKENKLMKQISTKNNFENHTMKKLFIAFLLLPLALMAQKNYPVLMDNYMKAQENIREFSGTVLIVQKDKTIYEKAFGLADREWNIPNTINTKYRIGSVTKQFTAVCIMQLAEEGKLSVNDKLSKYIPSYPKGDSVSIHMLLNHTSGIKDYTSMESFWPKATLPLVPDSMIALFINEPYDFSPGTKWNYSNSGYFLLGVIIEKVSGTTFSDYLLRNVIQKTGLKNTNLDNVDSILQYRAKGYSKDGVKWKNAMFISMEVPYSAGAMFSTVHDLHQWMKALMENKVVSAASVQKMTTATLNNYGYGLSIDSNATHKRIGHSGGIPGFTSYLCYYPADDVYAVAISNNESKASTVANGLAAILFNLPVLTPYIPKEIKLPAAEMDKFLGSYKFLTNTFDIIKKNDTLYRRRVGASDIKLKIESNTRLFFADGSDRFFEFQFDKNGLVEKAWFINVADRQEIKKQ